MLARQIDLPLAVPVCAWCRPAELGAGPGLLSHGICPRHLRKIKLKLQRMSGAIPKRSRRSQTKTQPGAEVLVLPL